MGRKKDMFDNFLDKQFGEGGRGVTIAKPVGGERSTTFQDRLRREEASSRDADAVAAPAPETPKVTEAPAAPEAPEAVAAEAAPRRPGRPKSTTKQLVPFNFLMEKDLKTRLELLKIELYRSSVTDLVKEAIHDLLVKYGKEGGSE